MRSRWMGCGVLLLGLAACGPEQSREPAPEETEMAQEMTIADVIRLHSEHLMAMPGVSMVGEGLNEAGAPCIRIGLIAEDEALRASLPAELEGFPVEIVVTGEFKPKFDR